MSASSGFVSEVERVGVQRRREFSIFDPTARLWLTRSPTAVIRVDSSEPLRLGLLFPNVPEDTRHFATELLKQVHEQAQTGEVIGPTTVDILPTVADRLIVCAFDYEVRQTIPTGLEFNHGFNQGKRVVFEVQGPPGKVEEYLSGYEAEFPPHLYKTSFTTHVSTTVCRRVRIIRDRKFD